jgi:hypothetical protein
MVEFLTEEDGGWRRSDSKEMRVPQVSHLRFGFCGLRIRCFALRSVAKITETTPTSAAIPVKIGTDCPT